MPKFLVSLTVILSSLCSYAEPTSLSRHLRLPDGLTASLTGQVVGSDEYALASAKGRHSVKKGNSTPLEFFTNPNGEITGWLAHYQKRKSMLNIKPGEISATDCEFSSLTDADAMDCMTATPVLCKHMLKISGHKNFDDFSQSVDMCATLTDKVIDDPAIQAANRLEDMNLKTFIGEYSRWKPFTNTKYQSRSDEVTEKPGILGAREDSKDRKRKATFAYFAWLADACRLPALADAMNGKVPASPKFKFEGRSLTK